MDFYVKILYILQIINVKMSKQYRLFLMKIFILSSILVLVFNVAWMFMTEENLELNSAQENNNKTNFTNIETPLLAKTWVALTTNVWIRYKQRTETPATIYRDIYSISEIISREKIANKELIWNNMLILEEYSNVLKTDIKALINQSYDKPRALNALIDQLEFRYTLWVENMKKLNRQKQIFINSMTSSSTSIESLKEKITWDFKNNKSKESLENIEKYLELKKEYYYARTYTIYINHFLTRYNYLNNYNKKLLDTLINNKDALVKDAYIVLPDSWTGLLKKFDLIYDEAEFKQK